MHYCLAQTTSSPSDFVERWSDSFHGIIASVVKAEVVDGIVEEVIQDEIPKLAVVVGMLLNPHHYVCIRPRQNQTQVV